MLYKIRSVTQVSLRIFYPCARICSARDCFFCLHTIQTDRTASMPNSTRRNSPRIKTVSAAKSA